MAKRIEILQVIPFYVPAWGFGGPVKVCADIATKLATLGNRVTVVTTDALSARSRITWLSEIRKGVKIIRFRNVSPYLSKEFNLHLPRGINTWCKKNIHKFDIVHIHTFYTLLSVTAAKACMQKKIPYVLHLHESPVPLPVLGRVKIKKAFMGAWGRKMLQGAKTIIVVSDVERKYLAEFYPLIEKKIVVITNPVDLDDIKVIKKINARKIIGLPADAKILLSLSRIAPIKRIDLIIRALRELVKKDDQYRLIIAGNDECGEEKRLQKMIDKYRLVDKVEIVGQVDGSKKIALLAASDVYILVSAYESFGMSVLEAKQYNLPICLSKNIGVANALRGQKNISIVQDPQNARQFSDEINRLYQWGQKNRIDSNVVLKQFSINRIIKLINNIYQLSTTSSKRQ